MQIHIVSSLWYVHRLSHDSFSSSWCLSPQLSPHPCRRITGIPYPNSFNTPSSLCPLPACVQAVPHACKCVCAHVLLLTGVLPEPEITTLKLLCRGFPLASSSPLTPATPSPLHHSVFYFFYIFLVLKASQRKRDTISSAALGDCWWLMHLLLEHCLFNAAPSQYSMLAMALSARHAGSLSQQSSALTQSLHSLQPFLPTASFNSRQIQIRLKPRFPFIAK